MYFVGLCLMIITRAELNYTSLITFVIAIEKYESANKNIYYS